LNPAVSDRWALVDDGFPDGGFGFDGGGHGLTDRAGKGGVLVSTLRALGFDAATEDDPKDPLTALVSARVPFPSPPVPPHEPPHLDRPGLQDPPTRTRLRALRLRVWLPTLLSLGLLTVMVVTLYVERAAGVHRPATDWIGVIVWADIFFLFVFLLPVVALHRLIWARPRRVLRHAPWQLTEYVAVSDRRRDGSARAVVLLDPLTGRPTSTWLLQDRDRSFPTFDQRLWAYVSIDERAKHAALAPVGRERVVPMVRTRRPPDRTASRIADRLERWDFGPPSVPPQMGPRVEDVPSRSRWARSNFRPLKRWERIAIVMLLVGIAGWATQDAVASRHRDRQARAELIATGHRSHAVVEPCCAGSNPSGGASSRSALHLVDGPAAGWTVYNVSDARRLEPGSRVTVAYADPSDLTGLVVIGHPVQDDWFGLAFFSWFAAAGVAVYLGWNAIRDEAGTRHPVAVGRGRRARYLLVRTGWSDLTPRDRWWLEPLLDRPRARLRVYWWGVGWRQALLLGIGVAMVVAGLPAGWPLIGLALPMSAFGWPWAARTIRRDRARIMGTAVPRKRLRLGRHRSLSRRR
jgi:hypothetical protein